MYRLLTVYYFHFCCKFLFAANFFVKIIEIRKKICYNKLYVEISEKFLSGGLFEWKIQSDLP